MTAIVTGQDGSERQAFIAGWRSLNRPTPIRELRTVSPAPGPLAMIDPSRVDAPEDSGIVCGSTALFADFLGNILTQARDDDVVVCARPALVHDGGAGAWGALGADPGVLAGAARRVTVAWTEATPLLSLHGRAAELSTRGLVAAERAQEAERQVGQFVADLARAPGFESAIGLARQAGTGMAGGLAFLLAAMGARLVDAGTEIAHRSGWKDQVAGADVVIALCAEDDLLAAETGPLVQLSTIAAQAAVPLVVVGAAPGLPRRHLARMGIGAAHDRAGRTTWELGRALAATWAARSV
ncbi:MAG: glycerate kinase [Bowdeniella nasicola]|nr:glycerate kinase [Bowdeniella nasicola]